MFERLSVHKTAHNNMKYRLKSLKAQVSILKQEIERLTAERKTYGRQIRRAEKQGKKWLDRERGAR